MLLITQPEGDGLPTYKLNSAVSLAIGTRSKINEMEPTSSTLAKVKLFLHMNFY